MNKIEKVIKTIKNIPNNIWFKCLDDYDIKSKNKWAAPSFPRTIKNITEYVPPNICVGDVYQLNKYEEARFLVTAVYETGFDVIYCSGNTKNFSFKEWQLFAPDYWLVSRNKRVVVTVEN